MKHTATRMGWVRSLLLSLVALASVAATVVACSGGTPCAGVGESCSENSDCCHNHCEEGRCCRGIGADLDLADPASDCCSGQIRTGPYGPFCCGTDGMEVSTEDRCCELYSWNPTTHRCEAPPCPAGYTWRENAAVVGGGGCVGPGDVTVPPEIPEPEPPPCSRCDDLSEPDCWFYRVYHEGYFDDELGTECRAFGPFQASDERMAEECARRLAAEQGLPMDHRVWVVEDISDWPGRECLME
jgi:hypothetical protein